MVGKLKKIQPRLIKQPKLQIDLNVEDTFDLQNLFGKKVHFLFLHFSFSLFISPSSNNNSQSFGLNCFNQLKIALAPLVISILEPYYHEQFLPKSQRTDKYDPKFKITTF